MYKISWEQYLKDTKYLIHKIRSRRRKYGCILAVSRGGLILGTILSHALNLPLSLIIVESYKKREQREIKISDIIVSPRFYESRDFRRKMASKSKMKWLLVDDLVDGGGTIRAIKNKYSWIHFDTAVLYHKSKCEEPQYWISDFRTWLEFPFEKAS